jgi:ribosomal protein L7/L12
MAEARELLEIKQRIALLEARIEQLFDQLGVEPEKRPPRGGAESGRDGGWWGGSDDDQGIAGPSGKVLELVRQGNKIEAIKAYREETGLGLKEAKDAIDDL